jgi:hypothetical protein
VAPEANETQHFPGFPDFRANVTFVPIQFFTVVVPRCSRGTVRIVGYALRKVLGWVDEHGNPTREQLRFSYRELTAKAGVSRDCIADALREATERRCLRCVQTAEPDRAGLPGQSGVYELCWDQDGPYTDRPADFKGFYYPEAVVIQEREQGMVVSRPKAARKNIPNAFFDYLLPKERLSVIRVVAALLFYSIQWGPGGERKVPVSRSITELCRLTGMSRHHVHGAVMAACQSGYIEQIDHGCFDPCAGKESRAATYGIRWAKPIRVERAPEPQEAPSGQVGEGEREQRQTETRNVEPVGKSERDRSEKVNGERSKMVNGIRVKRELKNDQSTAKGSDPAAATSALCPEPFAVANSGLDFLLEAGFDKVTAAMLARRNATEVIQRQIEWLPYRTANRNRLGLLRRAIEEDWPKPSGAELAGTDSELHSAAKLFARHYYPAYHGFSGEAGTEPFPKDIQVGVQFVSRLLRQENDPAKLPEWGRRFGRFMSDAHKGDPKAKPNLSFALVLYGDKFLKKLQSEGEARRTEALGKARKAHHAAFAGVYLSFLRQAEIELQQAKPSVYETFSKHREKLRRSMTNGPLLVSADWIAVFDTEESRLLALAEFFGKNPHAHVPDFWEWDARFNPGKFGANTASAASQEAYA